PQTANRRRHTPSDYTVRECASAGTAREEPLPGRACCSLESRGCRARQGSHARPPAMSRLHSARATAHQTAAPRRTFDNLRKMQSFPNPSVATLTVEQLHKQTASARLAKASAGTASR